MSYSYSNDNFSTAFGPGDFNLHQYPGLESSPGTASELRMNDAFVNSWGRIDQPTPIAGPSMSNPVPTTYGPTASNQYGLPHTNGCPQPLYSGQYNPEPQFLPQSNQYFPLPGIQKQFKPIGLSNWDVSFTTASEASAATLTPRNAMPVHGSANQSGLTVDAFDYMRNVHTPYRSSTGPTRTEPSRTERLRSYGRPRARTMEHANAEVGSSNLPPRLTPSAGAASDFQAYNTLANGWGVINQPAPIVGPPTSATYDMSTANLNMPQTNGYAQPSYSSRYNPEPQSLPYSGQHFHLPDIQDQFEPTGLPNWDGSREVKAPAVVPVPSSTTLDHWSGNLSEPTLGAFDYKNAHTSHRPDTGPTRSELSQVRRFWPYRTSRARATEHVNAEAGPSALPPSRVPSAGPPAPQPSGGTPETTANAEKNQPYTEKNQAPKPKRSRQTKAPRESGTKKPRRHRVQLEISVPRLRNWARRYMGDLALPPLADALAIAAEFMPTVRRVVNQKPCLLGAKTKEVGAVSEGAMKERGRRVIERDYLLKLSRYYPRVKGQWSRGDLITKVVEDLEGPLTESE